MNIERDTPQSAWDEFWQDVSSEEWLAAKALLELEPHLAVRRDAERWLRRSDGDGEYDPDGDWRWNVELPWEKWVADVDGTGRGWSSTEWRLYDVVAGLTTGRPFNIVGVLDRMGSWETGVWRTSLTGARGEQQDGRRPVDARAARLNWLLLD